MSVLFSKVKLGELGKVSMCKRILKHETSEFEEIPFYKISTFGGKADTFISREIYELYKNKYSYPKVGDVLFSAAGTIGKTVIYDGSPAFFQDSNIVWIANNETIILNRFLYYFYQTKPWITSKGSTILRLYNDNIRSIEINFPNIEIQSKIAKVLSDLDAKIELNNKINAELGAMAKLMYDYWFVQFEFPNEEGKPYKSSGGKMVWNEELKREVPEGWDVKELKNISTCLMGQSPKGESYNKDGIGIPLINGPADYENGSLVGRTFTTEPTRLCQKDDMVLCIRATIGNLTFSEKEFCLGRGVAAVRPNQKEYSEFIYYFLLQEIERFKKHATGSIIVGITKDDLIDSKCLIPKRSIIEQFHKTIYPSFMKLRKNKEENLNLSKLRDWLLPMLMNGQVRIDKLSEPEEHFSMAAEEREKYK